MIRFGAPADDDQPERGDRAAAIADEPRLNDQPDRNSDSLKEELAGFSEQQLGDQVKEMAADILNGLLGRLTDAGVIRPAPPTPQELAATTGTVIVLGRATAAGVQVQVVNVQTGATRRAVMAEQMVSGERRLAAVLPRVPPGEYDLFDYRHFGQIDVLAGEVTVVDWRGRRSA